MALVVIRVGSAVDIFQYDDGAFDSAIETTAPMKAGSPIDVNDVVILGANTPGAVTPVAVVDIDDPSAELNALEGTLGSSILCYEVLAATNEYTIYAFDESDTGGEDVPYTVDADTSGLWVAVAGKYSNFAPSLHIITSHTDSALAGLANDDLMQWNDPGSIWEAKDIAEVILAQIIAPGNINSSGMVRQNNIWHAYGGFEDQAETVACGVGDWNLITNAGNNLWNLDETDGISIAADVLTLTNVGDYEGVLSLSLSAINGKDFHVRIYNNTQAAVMGRPIGISTTGASNEMNVCVPIYIEADAGDDIQFEIMSADGTDPVVDDGLFVIKYLHD